jgi:hypothetical protein
MHGTAEVAVGGAALLMAARLAHQTVHVQDEFGELAMLVGLVDPTGQRGPSGA